MKQKTSKQFGSLILWQMPDTVSTADELQPSSSSTAGQDHYQHLPILEEIKEFRQSKFISLELVVDFHKEVKKTRLGY